MSSESKYENSGGKVLHTSSLEFLKREEKKGQHPLPKRTLHHEYYITLF